MNRRAFTAIMVLPVVIALAGWWYWTPRDTTLPIRESVTPAPTAHAVPAAVAPTPTATTAATVVRHPPPTPPALPVSNAFTTLEDYRRRRAARPQTPAPLTTPPAGKTPETELGHVGFMVRDFRAAFGSNPVGSNKEITRALMGNNAGGVKFLDPASASLDAKGELLDEWGHPYFFHALSGTTMEIRSAGPDGKVFTDDDLVR